MTDLLRIVILFVILSPIIYPIIQNIIAAHSSRLGIWRTGGRIPFLIQKLAGISNPIAGKFYYQDFSKEDQVKVKEVFSLFEEKVSQIVLTFLYNQNLVFVSAKGKAEFIPLDKYNCYLLWENIGTLSNKDKVIFKIERKSRGLSGSAILTGYLVVQPETFSEKTELEENKPEVLFEFPEVLINYHGFLWRFILRLKSLESKYFLEREVYWTDGGYKDDFGKLTYTESIDYRQKENKDFGFQFSIQNPYFLFV